MKTCSNSECKEINPQSFVNFRINRNKCKQCEKAYNKQWNSSWYKENSKVAKEKSSLWNKMNPDKAKYINKKWKIDNRDSLREYHAIYCKQRYKNDLQFKISSNLRSRLNSAIRNAQKSGSAVRDLGCTISEFKQYFETKYGVNWKDYGVIWEIDHIKPLSHFDLTNRDQLLKAVHYTNLRPMTPHQNRSEGNRR